MKEVFERKYQNIKKKDFELKFYEHYFKDISTQFQIPIENFFDPRNFSGKKSEIPKTINETYVKNIQRSNSFCQEFFDFMNNSLVPLNKEGLAHKIETLVSKWQKTITDVNDIDTAVKLICKEIETNKKAKLPWTIQEIEEAIRKVRQLFELNQKK